MGSVQGESPRSTWRLGIVSYLNAKPLIEGLDAEDDVKLVYEVPARLPAMLDAGTVDVALVPVIDVVAPNRAWRIVSDACIGCEGETLTVRVFSRVPRESIRTLHVDADSHTSVALAGVIWRELYGTVLRIVRLTGDERVDDCEAILLIGDKVVANELVEHDVQTDLGAAWNSLTSLPFVFAVWAAPQEADVAGLAQRLARARDAGVRSAESIASAFGPALGWPVALAKRYLTSNLTFTLGPRQRRGIERFLELAKRHRIVPADRELLFTCPGV